jgi:hypothetical protein
MKEPPEVGLKEGSVPVWRLSGEAGGYVGWADGGKTITWGLGNVFHRLAVADAIRFVEEEKKKPPRKRRAPVRRGTKTRRRKRRRRARTRSASRNRRRSRFISRPSAGPGRLFSCAARAS